MTDVTRNYRGVAASDRREQRRRALLEACLELVDAGGIPAVTAESAAARARLTKRYFYESFGDREAILVAALNDVFVELLATIRAGIDGASPDSRPAAVAEIFVATLCDDPRRARLYAESAALPALAALREEAISVFTDLMIDAGDPRDAAHEPVRRLVTRIVVAGVTEVVTSWINGTVKTDRATLTDAIVTLGRAAGSSRRPPS